MPPTLWIHARRVAGVDEIGGAPLSSVLVGYRRWNRNSLVELATLVAYASSLRCPGRNALPSVLTTAPDRA